MRRYEISDEQWERIADLLPNNENKRGAPWKDHRRMLNGMFWILCSGAPWRDLPACYGNWKTVYDRFRRYRIDDMFDKILARLQLELNEEGLIDYSLWEIDSTTVRAHKSAAGAGEKRGNKPVKENLQIMHKVDATRSF